MRTSTLLAPSLHDGATDLERLDALNRSANITQHVGNFPVATSSLVF